MANLFFTSSYLKQVFPSINRTEGTTKCILVAENDDANYLYLQVITRKMNLQLIRVNDGMEAVKAVRSNPDIALVLMNTRLPIMDGLEATSMIRRFKPGLPVIAISSSNFPEPFYKALEAGCCDYVTKPVQPAEYREVIETWFPQVAGA